MANILLENFEFFLGNLTDLSKSEKRVPLVCSQEDATQEVDKDGEGELCYTIGVNILHANHSKSTSS